MADRQRSRGMEFALCGKWMSLLKSCTPVCVYVWCFSFKLTGASGIVECLVLLGTDFCRCICPVFFLVSSTLGSCLPVFGSVTCEFYFPRSTRQTCQDIGSHSGARVPHSARDVTELSNVPQPTLQSNLKEKSVVRNSSSQWCSVGNGVTWRRTVSSWQREKSRANGFKSDRIPRRGRARKS